MLLFGGAIDLKGSEAPRRVFQPLSPFQWSDELLTSSGLIRLAEAKMRLNPQALMILTASNLVFNLLSPRWLVHTVFYISYPSISCGLTSSSSISPPALTWVLGPTTFAHFEQSAQLPLNPYCMFYMCLREWFIIVSMPFKNKNVCDN